MKVSFDFDKTLSRGDVQTYAKELINSGIEVWLITGRDPKDFDNDELFSIAERLGIPKEHIKFTNNVKKAIFFENNPGFIWHLDDNPHELISIERRNVEPIGVSVGSPYYKEICNDILNKL